jgi:hypothetical protein
MNGLMISTNRTKIDDNLFLQQFYYLSDFQYFKSVKQSDNLLSLVDEDKNAIVIYENRRQGSGG